MSQEQQEGNWFSAQSALRVYGKKTASNAFKQVICTNCMNPTILKMAGQYLSLDTDHNGMLSKEELLK